MEKNEKLLRYSMQLAYLHTLLSAKLITESEYSRIKKKLQKDYKVPSDILADFESRDVRWGKGGEADGKSRCNQGSGICD